MERRVFDYKTLWPCIYQPQSLELERQAFDSMHLVNAMNGMGKVTNCELVLNLPGPIYVFAVNISKYHGGTESQFVITGCLTFFRIDIPGEYDLETDARDRVLLYFGHLLLYCFCKPKYKPPFLMRKGLDRSKYEDNFQTKKHLHDSIIGALPALGYSSVTDFMPILKDLELKEDGMTYLDGRYYQQAVENPIDIDNFLNFHDSPAPHLKPHLFSYKRKKV
ncbi:MAG: hypothetical protein WCI55_12095 [Armatimonadota bacterium]